MVYTSVPLFDSWSVVENPPISIPIPSNSETGAPVIASVLGSNGKATSFPSPVTTNRCPVGE